VCLGALSALVPQCIGGLRTLVPLVLLEWSWCIGAMSALAPFVPSALGALLALVAPVPSSALNVDIALNVLSGLRCCWRLSALSVLGTKRRNALVGLMPQCSWHPSCLECP